MKENMEYKVKQKRNDSLDIMKGLAIIIVVANHASMPFFVWTSLLELSLFFITAGYCYKKNGDFNQSVHYIIKKFKSLYIPCTFFTGLCSLCNNFLVNVGIIDNELYSFNDLLRQLMKCLLFSGGGQLSGTVWFLRCLFGALVLYTMIVFACSKTGMSDKLITVTCISFSIIGWIIGLLKIPGYQYFNSFTVVFCIELGRLMKINEIKYCIPGEKTKKIESLIIVIISAFFLRLLVGFGFFSVRENQIINPLMYYTCAVLGWVFMCNFSNLIRNVFCLAIPLKIIGRHTLVIMLLHFSAFKIVTLIQILMLGLDWEMLKAHPCLITEHNWWAVYTIIGVFIPLCISLICDNGKRILKSYQAY